MDDASSGHDALLVAPGSSLCGGGFLHLRMGRACKRADGAGRACQLASIPYLPCFPLRHIWRRTVAALRGIMAEIAARADSYLFGRFGLLEFIAVACGKGRVKRTVWTVFGGSLVAHASLAYAESGADGRFILAVTIVLFMVSAGLINIFLALRELGNRVEELTKEFWKLVERDEV